ncbi:hypothetical protein [Rhodopila sp.]|jgi:hypothetical protein|uniref:hypothetical protein n=1 Tax=Rhodopila sp. TaxID=2480087 RepID=UPI002C0E8979|nr:hypothetical protein [Rhodopila sp.]HVZ10296.1 hypothetical protein [Rhodopila sp.]
MSDQALPPARHERRDIGFRAVAIGAACATLLLMALIGLTALVAPRAMHQPDSPLPRMAAPGLQIDPRADYARFHATALRRLDGFGWIDRSAGTAHIPITQAMRLTAARGIAGWPGQ